MSKRAFEGVQRRDCFYVDPELLVLITDPSHALYDARALEPPDEAMVLNVLALGVLEPVLARMNDGVAEVVAGRRRVLACREANRRSKAAGGPGVFCPVMTRKGDDGLMALGMIAENEHRRADNWLARARKAQSLLDLGSLSEEKVANAFGVEVPALKRWLKVLDADKAVQKALEDGRIGMSAAAQLARLPHEEQREKLRDLLANGAQRVTTSEVRRAVSGDGSAGPTRKRPTAAQVRKALEVAEANDIEPSGAGKYDHHVGAAVVLRWVTGTVTTEEARRVLPWLPELAG